MFDSDSDEEPLQTVDPTQLPKHLRLRYWTSQEELALVDSWRQHFSAVVGFDKNYPIYRVISDEMREQNFNVNPQECRRRINILRNKYFVEQKRLEVDNEYVSDWRLYPLLHSMLREGANNELDHLHEVITEFIATIPKEKLMVGDKKGFPNFEYCKSEEALSCFIYPLPLSIKTEVKTEKTENATDGSSAVPVATPKPTRAPTRRMSILLAAQPASDYNSNMPAPPPPPPPIIKRRYIRRNSIDCNNNPFRVHKKFINENLVNLRVHNNNLAEQLILAERKLKSDEQNYKVLERMCETWLAQQQMVLDMLQRQL